VTTGSDHTDPVTDANHLGMPWPGEELTARVTGVTDRKWFFETGQRSVADTQAALSVLGRDIASFETILDFGCGCGRMLLWLEDVGTKCSLHGVDIDERAIRWVDEHVPYVSARVNQPLPPLDYPDGFFDLVFNHSVFTHIDEQYQDLWLAELRRVTRPGGTVVLSVHGENAFFEYENASRNAGGRPETVRDRLARDGIAFIREDPWVGSPFPDFYHTTFHAPWYIFDHWSRFFTVKAFVPRGSLGHQDLVVLERPAPDAVVGEPVSPARAARATPLPAPAATGVGSAAIERAAAELDAGLDVSSATNKGVAAQVARRGVLRVLRHYMEHQRRFDAAVVEALRDLDHAKGAETVGDITLQDSNARLWDALRRGGERVNRLEADLFEALRRGGLDTPPAGGDQPPD
jgi:SAM-dependent methyltransferase